MNTYYFVLKGTGKTRTLVSAIEEIILHSSENAILVCANSNAAADEITERLLKVIDESQIFRMYAKSYSKNKIPNEIRKVCNINEEEIRIPCLKFLYEYRVLVCTLHTAGVLARARDDPDFKSNHFSHVIIDEAACTHETVAMIAIAGKYV